MPKMQPFLYGNGGNVIMVQVENEYGSYDACDREYQRFAVNETGGYWQRRNDQQKLIWFFYLLSKEKYVQGKAVLFTNDGPWQLRCGKIPGVLATLDFGSGKNNLKILEQVYIYH
jgi:beta-galactosidase